MAATLSVTVNGNPFLDGTGPTQIILNWVSHTDGSVSKGIASNYTTGLGSGSASPIAPSKVKGMFKSIEFIPGLNGDLTTSLPTPNYGVSILDAYGYDILDKAGVSRSSTVAEKLFPADYFIIDSELTLTIASAGDTKKGRIIIELEAIEGQLGAV
jgi:hypothetical protein